MINEYNYPVNGETKRIKVRPTKVDDYVEWIPFFKDSESTKYFPNPEKLREVELAKKWVNSHIGNYEAGVFGQMALVDKKSGKIVGSAGFLMCELDGKIEIQTGVAILPQHQKKRYALEALEYLNTLAKNYNIDSLISVVHKDNVASQKLTQKAGKIFEKEILYDNCPAYLYRKPL